MTIRTMLRPAAAGVLIIAALAVAASAAPPAPPAPRGDDGAPKNLQVFPKDIAKRDLIGAMESWDRALGVHCDYCHEEKVPGDHQSIDFASDKIDHKLTARRMMTMVRDLNAGPLPVAAGQKDAAVSCVNCHHGLVEPTTLDLVVLDAVRTGGADAGVKKYRELRDKYYGSGAFDFGPQSLNPVIAALATDKSRLDAAVTICRLNLEMFPQQAEGHVMLAQVLLMKEDKVGAAAALDQALKLDPANRHAQRLKKQMGQ